MCRGWRDQSLASHSESQGSIPDQPVSNLVVGNVKTGRIFQRALRFCPVGKMDHESGPFVSTDPSSIIF